MWWPAPLCASGRRREDRFALFAWGNAPYGGQKADILRRTRSVSCSNALDLADAGQEQQHRSLFMPPRSSAAATPPPHQNAGARRQAQTTLHRIARPSETTTGASSGERCRRSLSRVADAVSNEIVTPTPAGRRAAGPGPDPPAGCARETHREITSPTPVSSGSLDHASVPSVTTSRRVCGPTQVSARMRATVSPGFSPSSSASRCATRRQAPQLEQR